MGKTILHRLFGVGKLPDGDRKALEAEGIAILDEGIAGSVTYKNYRASGKIFLRRKRWFTGSIAVTARRFVAYTYSRRVFNFPFEDPRLSKLQISTEDGRYLRLAYEASDLLAGQSGRVEFRFSTPYAEEITRLLKGRAT